jgi:hypothetical protein
LPLQILDGLLLVRIQERQIVNQNALFMRRFRVDLDNRANDVLKLRQRRAAGGPGGFDVLDKLPAISNEDCEQDRFLGVEVVIERAARQLAGVGKVGDRGAHIALGRKQPGGIGQDTQVDAVVILRACSRHGISSASIQL